MMSAATFDVTEWLVALVTNPQHWFGVLIVGGIAHLVVVARGIRTESARIADQLKLMNGRVLKLEIKHSELEKDLAQESGAVRGELDRVWRRLERPQ